MGDKDLTRRNFLQKLAIAVPAGSVLLQSQLKAEDLPQLDEADPVAKALVYVHNVADLDTANPLAQRYEDGQTCANCAQIQGEDGATWRPCGIFPGKVVSADGWCSVWAPMPA
jgi:hypothetical protein